MNGLTAANVERIVIGLKIGMREAVLANSSIAAKELADVLSLIEAMQRENTTHASRPDRVGDECWCGVYEQNVGYSWRKGILRAWCHGDCPAIVEDAETKEIDYFSRVSFSTEAPA
jgi:hypothetical protein